MTFTDFSSSLVWGKFRPHTLEKRMMADIFHLDIALILPQMWTLLGSYHLSVNNSRTYSPFVPRRYFAGSDQSVGSGTVNSVPGYEDAQHDVLLAMMAWVENGTAPEYIIATTYNNDTDPLGEGVYRQRPLCMYPKQAKYTGSGDVDAPESWECQSLYWKALLMMDMVSITNPIVQDAHCRVPIPTLVRTRMDAF